MLENHEIQNEEMEMTYVITDLQLVELEELRTATSESMDHYMAEPSWLPSLHC